MHSSCGRALLALALVGTGLALGAGVAEAQRPRPAAAAAQATGRPIRFGETLRDSLIASDPKRSERGAFRVYRFTARSSKRYVIAMNTEAFDAYVTVMREIGGITDEIASDDDSGGNTNARLRFTPVADGSYLIVAQSLSSDGLGAFTLMVEETDPPVVPPMVPLKVGATVSGQLTESSPIEDAEGHPYNHYSLRGDGLRVRLTMRSEDFDAYLVVKKRLPDGSEEDVATDDDSGGDTDARLTLVLDGEYRVIARPLNATARGAFTLAVEEVQPVAVVQRPVRAGQSLPGELTDADPELEDGGFFHEYVLDADAGDEFRITLRSEAFDAYLRWGTKDGLAFTELNSDDDSGGDLDSQLTVRVMTRGRYVIRVSSLSAGSTGAYTLSVERAGQ